MKVLLSVRENIPAIKYGGTNRVVWWLGKKLVELGHEVVFLAPRGSKSSFAEVLPWDFTEPFNRLVPHDVDVVHLNSATNEPVAKPHLLTYHWIGDPGCEHHPNTVFISAKQAEQNGGSVFVHHGLDIDKYGKPDFSLPRKKVVFLAKAAWRVKNVRGAIRIARAANRALAVAGGTRLNFNMGFRFTWDRNVQFHGMVDDEQKRELLQRSQALLFPVLWHEPFGLALIEAMYYGCPVFGTPYGSLPEIITPEVGFLSNSEQELAERLSNLEDQFERRHCHEYVCDRFSSDRMARNYVRLYEQVIDGQPLHASPPTGASHRSPKSLPMAA